MALIIRNDFNKVSYFGAHIFFSGKAKNAGIAGAMVSLPAGKGRYF